jgi:hypothetical protein
MKKLLLLSKAILVFSFANAQTEKGNFLLGGDLANFKFGLVDNSGTTISLNPKAGYFVADRVAMGISMPINFDKNEFEDIEGNYLTKSTNFGFGYFWRYYFSKGYPFNFFAGIDFGVLTFKYKSEYTLANSSPVISTQRGQDFYFIFDAGIVYFLSKSVGIESVLSTSNLTNDGMTLNFRVGFQIYLNTSK